MFTSLHASSCARAGSGFEFGGPGELQSPAVGSCIPLSDQRPQPLVRLDHEGAGEPARQFGPLDCEQTDSKIRVSSPS